MAFFDTTKFPDFGDYLPDPGDYLPDPGDYPSMNTGIELGKRRSPKTY
jgi:hypothetical protein